MPAASITLDEALDLARTGDVWLFRGSWVADRAVRGGYRRLVVLFLYLVQFRYCW